MKLRIHHQEIRFRLSLRDVEHLEKNELLTDQLQLTRDVKWSYALCLDATDGSRVSLNETGHSFNLHLPLVKFRSWLASPDIEWLIEQSAPKLTLLIEKDLKPTRT